MQPHRQPDGLRFLENLAYLVPGYQGYRQRSRRREEDAQLRARVVRELRELLQAVDALHDQWAVDATDAACEQVYYRRLRLEAIAESLRCAPYRARGFFESELVPESALEQILEADLLVLEDLSDARHCLEEIGLQATAPRDLASFFAPLDLQCDHLEGHLIMREKLLASV
ncbi:MAG: hypothetical protein GF330_01315 [Candidatus Eisenbacteria bacterium]|nr:hypothetical protein [Candidatus Eisenbacteria bacterium]